MPEFILKARSGLNHDKPFAAQWEGFAAREIIGEHVWWGGIPHDGADAFARALKKHFECAAPAPGKFAQGAKVRFVHAGDHQFFMMGTDATAAGLLENAAFLTEQTDGWIGIVVEGERSRAVLEKLVGIDVHPSAFPSGSAARIPVEGMLALIVCEDDAAPRFAMHFQRSSARSFIEHLCHAAASACGPAQSGAH